MPFFRFFCDKQNNISEQALQQYLTTQQDTYKTTLFQFERAKEIILTKLRSVLAEWNVGYEQLNTAWNASINSTNTALFRLAYPDQNNAVQTVQSELVKRSHEALDAHTKKLEELKDFIKKIEKNESIDTTRNLRYDCNGYLYSVNILDVISKENLASYNTLLKQKIALEKMLTYTTLINKLRMGAAEEESALVASIRKNIQALVPYIETEVRENPEFVSKAVDIMLAVIKLLDTKDQNGIIKYIYPRHRRDDEFGDPVSMYSRNNHDVKKLTDEVSGHSNGMIMLASIALIAAALFTLFIGLLLLSPKASIAVALAAPIVCYCALSLTVIGCIGLGIGYKKTGFAKQLSNIVDARATYENSLSKQDTLSLTDNMSNCIFGWH